MTNFAGNFRPLRTLATLSIIFLTLHVSLGALATLADIAAATWLPDWSAEEGPISDEALIAAVLFMLLGLGTIAAYIGTVIVFLMWLFRATANLRNWGVPMRTSPGWAVGWWFIPIANLFKPFQAVREVHDESAQISEPDEPRSAAALGWWWAGWIVCNLAGQASMRMSMRGDPAILAAARWIDVVSTVAAILAAVLLIGIIRRITGWQEASAAVALSPEVEPAAAGAACSRCGYDFLGVQRVACPECGQPQAAL